MFVGIADQMFIGPEVTYDHPQRSNRVVLPVFAGAEGAAGDTSKALTGTALSFVLCMSGSMQHAVHGLIMHGFCDFEKHQLLSAFVIVLGFFCIA